MTLGLKAGDSIAAGGAAGRLGPEREHRRASGSRRRGSSSASAGRVRGQRALPDERPAHLRGRRRASASPRWPPPRWSRPAWRWRTPSTSIRRNGSRPILPYGIYTIPECRWPARPRSRCKQARRRLRGRARRLRDQRPRADHRRRRRLPEAHLPARGHEAARRARHRRAGDRSWSTSGSPRCSAAPGRSSSSTPATTTRRSPSCTSTRRTTPWPSATRSESRGLPA